MTQVATSAADGDRRDVIPDRLITVSMAAMTAFCSLRQRNLESEPDERGQCAAEAERHAFVGGAPHSFEMHEQRAQKRLCADGRIRRRADHLAARATGRAAQLGLPFLLAARRHANTPRANEYGCFPFELHRNCSDGSPCSRSACPIGLRMS
jgi:hypothetical protein